MTFRALPQQSLLRDMFEYDPDTGILSNRRLRKVAGFITQGGNSTRPVRVVKVGPHYFMASRLIWMLVYNEDPGDLLVDHINRDSLDNRLENLRLLTRADNRRNSDRNKYAKHKYKGVYPNGKKWIARPTIDGKLKSLGTFDTQEEARDAITKLGIE